MQITGEQLLIVASLDETEVEAQLRALVEGYSPLLFRVARSVLRNRAEAEDAVQDTFVRVLKHRDALPAVRDLRVWLVRITWRIALDRRRRMTPEQMEDGFAEALAAKQLPPEQALAVAEQMRLVLRAVEQLPAAERRALLLAAVDELAPAEIAEVLGRSESAVRGLLFRARARLRARLGSPERRS